jgi:gluconokinase
MGVSGSGKSTVGAALAQRLGVPFADADAFHPEANIAKMAAGKPLTDDDRYPWLEAVGRWLADHEDGGVTGSPELIARRQAGRPGHFMPAALVKSQFDALEPLAPDEHGIACDVGASIDSIVERFLAYLSS